MFQDKIKIKSNSRINYRLTLISFKEDGHSILYSPKLNLTGYGDSEGEALNSFNEALSLYFEYVLSEETIDEDLAQLGWLKSQNQKRHFKTPKYSAKTVMSKKGVKTYGIHNIVNKLKL